MNLIYLLFGLAVGAVRARPEPPPLFMGLKQQHQRALPSNAFAADAQNYQELPQEHSFSNFVAGNAIYGAPFPNAMAAAMPDAMDMELLQEDSYKAAYQHSASQQHHTGYESGPTVTQVHKHIYVHVPPKDFEEEDTIKARVTHQGGPKQKHYKIVFIKAPTGPDVRAPMAPPPPQSEEKTLIYVLHKKPEIQTDIVIPTPEPTKPSKPEVYFIKYKNKRDEAPVYGPPAAPNEVESRSAVLERGDDFMSTDFGQYEIIDTTPQPEYPEEASKPQFSGDEPTEHYDAPTNTNFISDEVETTTAAPLVQYLPPDTTTAPIVVKEMENSIHLPVPSYGTSHHNRLFIKRRK